MTKEELIISFLKSKQSIAELFNNNLYDNKIIISIHVNFISSKDTGETCTIYIWRDNVSIMRGSDTDYIIREIFRSFLRNYQEELKIIKGSDFVFESVELVDYKLHRYVKSPEWLANKKATINPKNKNDDECLRWSTISASNYNEIMKKEFENIFKKIKDEDKDFSSHQRNWKNFDLDKLLLISYLHRKIVKK